MIVSMNCHYGYALLVCCPVNFYSIMHYVWYGMFLYFYLIGLKIWTDTFGKKN